jgi:PRTRC genetic system protein B
MDCGYGHLRVPYVPMQIFRAPYWNVNDGGSVCLGDTRTPDSGGAASLKQWETVFFESMFTHQNAQKRLTTHPGGFVGPWRELPVRSPSPRGTWRPPTRHWATTFSR